MPAAMRRGTAPNVRLATLRLLLVAAGLAITVSWGRQVDCQRLQPGIQHRQGPQLVAHLSGRQSGDDRGQGHQIVEGQAGHVGRPTGPLLGFAPGVVLPSGELFPTPPRLPGKQAPALLLPGVEPTAQTLPTLTENNIRQHTDPPSFEHGMSYT